MRVMQHELAVSLKPVARAAYKAQHVSILYSCLAGHELLRTVAGARVHPADDAVAAMRRRYFELLERDLANVAAGLYPRELLFQMPVRTYARALPKLAADLPRTIRRFRRRDFHDLPRDLDRERYPAYFRRNFHWQTDGYFSRRSAELYDVAVELLFLGAADVMRRQVIPPIARFLDREGIAAGRLLDVACGTGRTLLQIGRARPKLRLFGVDLSPHYAALARENLAELEDVAIAAENAEALPFRDGWFDAVTSVFLFHELPRAARRNVLGEMFRVLRPGGLLVLEDSAQLTESSEVAFFLSRFSQDFHEPFFRDYAEDDLAAAAAEMGFRVDAVETHFTSKVVVARRG